MQYAIIPIEHQEQLSWTYSIPVGSWAIPRMEADNSIKNYVGLEGQSFNEEQKSEIQSFAGIIFEDCDCFFVWRDQYGIICME